MEKRILKMLRRHEQHKNMPDFDAVCEAVERGYARMEGPSDDIAFTLTDKGRELLDRPRSEQGEG